MVSAINTALSGLAAAGKRLEVSANNIANQFSTKSRIDGVTVDKPFTPQQVDQVSISNGGVQTVVRDVNPATVGVNDQNADGGITQLPNVSLEQEIINQQLASYDYKANLKTLKVADEMQQSLLDILG